MPIKLTKNGVDSSFSGIEKVFFKGEKKNQKRYNKAFFSFFFTSKRTYSSGTKIIKKVMKGVQNL